MRVRDIHPDLYGTEWRYIKRVSRKHAMLMTLAVLPALYSLQQMDVQIQRKTNDKFGHRQLCSKHAGYKEYCQAKSLGEYFDKGATVSDYRRELRAGEFWFKHPRLHVLQHYRGRDWSVLHSGGDETVSREELKFLATKLRPQGSEALSEKEEQELVRLHTKVETEAMLLHLTGPQYLAIRYQAESILHASDKETDHLYGNMYDPNESLHDYMLLMANADKWCDSYVRKDNTADILCEIPEDQQQTLINAARRIRWDKVKNRRRKNVMQDDRPLQSFDLLHNVSHGKEYSELHRTLIAICRKNIKGFDPNDYNSIQVNRSEFMPIHKDKPNEGSSLTIAVGNYSGGELIISTKDARTLYDIKGKFLKFNGLSDHEVAPFAGIGGEPAERYSFVFYKCEAKPLPETPAIESIHLAMTWESPPKLNEKPKIMIEPKRLIDLQKIPLEERPAMIKAIYKEVQGLVDLGTFELVPHPMNHKPIDSRLVLKVKYKADGNFDKTKARLVARGFLARAGIDYFSTFSPMASLTSVRALISLAVSQGLPLKHSDIPQAFIQSDLDSQESYMRLPPGISLEKAGTSHEIVRLVKALYGLKQSPQLWAKELSRFMKNECHMQKAESETCLYYKHVGDEWIMILTEVDDLVYTGSDNLVNEFERMLKNRWDIKETGNLRSFLGINIHYDREQGRLTFDVAEKIKKIFKEKEWLADIGHASTPMENGKETKRQGIKDEVVRTRIRDKLSDPTNYASIVGACIYIAITCRPDISHAVGRVSRTMHKPTEQSIGQVIRLLQYLNNTKEHRLVYYRDGHPVMEQIRRYTKKDRDFSRLYLSKTDSDEIEGNHLFGQSDADFASKREDDLKSTTGYCFFMKHNLICWKSKLQPIIATSTHEAELIAVYTGAQEAIWLRNLLSEFNAAISGTPAKFDDTIDNDGKDPTYVTSMGETVMMCDNLGTTFSANNPSSQGRSKHVDIRYLKIRELMEQQRLIVKHIEGTNNIADVFTKQLPRDKFEDYLIDMGMDIGKNRRKADN